MRSVGNHRKWLIAENQGETSIPEGLSCSSPSGSTSQFLWSWPPFYLPLTLYWVLVPSGGPDAMAVTVCTGPGAHRGSMHGVTDHWHPDRIRCSICPYWHMGAQKAEEKCLQSRLSWWQNREVPIPSHYASFLLILLSLTLRSPGEVSPSARLPGFRQERRELSPSCKWQPLQAEPDLSTAETGKAEQPWGYSGSRRSSSNC